MEATKIDGKFVGDSGTAPEQGQAEVQALLERAYQSANNALEGQGKVAPGLKEKAETLLGLKSQLEKLELTQAWSLRETDLYEVIDILFRMDAERVDGKFLAEDGSAPSEGQTVSIHENHSIRAVLIRSPDSSLSSSEILCPCLHTPQLK